MAESASIDEIKQGIAKEYFKNIVVIDDDCYEDINTKDSIPRKINNQFTKLHKDCQENGILCHFQHYPKENPKEEKDPKGAYYKSHFETAIKLAEQCDVLILDWFLGLDKSEEHSLALINEIKDKNVIKFIIIYTAHSEEVVPKLTSIGFKNVYEKHANDDDESTGFQSASDEDTDDRGSHLSFSSVFISIISKNKTPNSEEIYKEIINITNVFSPDLIHWAGIEIFNKIRNVLPKLIGSLPEDIMPELAIQSLYKDDPDEIGMHITGLILQDVGSYISKKPPTLLNHDILITNFPKLKEIISKKNRNKENILKAVQWTLERNLKQNRKYTRDNIGIRANNLNKLSSYFESITSLGELYNNLEPGMILQYANSSEYFLCITPSCDLFRLKKGDIVTFINGKPENSLKKSFGQKYKQTSIKTSKALEIIRWDLSNIYQITAKENFIGYPEIIKLAEDPKILRFVGKLRNDIYNRILNLFYTYRTRVGIESVEIIRQIRNER